MQIKMSPAEKSITPPAEGWKPKTYYAVSVCVDASNPIWEAVFYTGFLSEEGAPQGYATVWSGTSNPVPFARVHYMRVNRELDLSS